MEAFPEFPKMNFSTKRRAMEKARKDMALNVLEQGVRVVVKGSKK